MQWDTDSGAKTRVFPTDTKHGPPIHALAASKDGKYLAMGGKDTLVHIYDIRQRRQGTRKSAKKKRMILRTPL